MPFRFFANAVIAMVVVIGLHTYAVVTPICVPLRSARLRASAAPSELAYGPSHGLRLFAMVFRTDSLPLMDDIALTNDVDMQLEYGFLRPTPRAPSTPHTQAPAQNGEMMRLRVQCCAYACNASRVQRSPPPRRSPNRRRARTKKWRIPRRPRVSPRRRFLSLRRRFPFLEILGTVRRCMASKRKMRP